MLELFTKLKKMKYSKVGEKIENDSVDTINVFIVKLWFLLIQVVVILLGLYLSGVSSVKEEESRVARHPEPDLSLESPEVSSEDLSSDATIWRHWKPGKLWKLGEKFNGFL